MYQSEAELEQDLIAQLQQLGYEKVAISQAHALRANFKTQLEALNGLRLSEAEFAKVLNYLNKGSVFERAKRLRDRMQLSCDDGSVQYLRFFNSEDWQQNRYQVTHQVTQEGRHKNRYDVTLLVNGLPLVQVELKRRGMELKEAFNQIQRYQQHSFWAEDGLFEYVQLFVISNGVNTKYYASNRDQDFKQTFFWTDPENQPLNRLAAFAEQFFAPAHLAKMIGQYIVLHETKKQLMVLRPYQFYAVEAIVQQVQSSQQNGYIWHTTGSGKTLTSFKAAQILVNVPQVHKVLFVVDRVDLDDQTSLEFNAFCPESVDPTTNTHGLVKQLEGDHKLIVTTIQKLNNALSKTHYLSKLEALQQQPVVLIFDECHRSQFGDTHKRITGFFQQAQLFGFTGTPIFADNATGNEHGKRTTKDLFNQCLHRYLITDAIRDDNVLRFAVEYWGKLRLKDGNTVDEQVNGIDTKAFFDNPERIEQIVDWVIAEHKRKTLNKQFSAIFCVSSVEALIQYYDSFKRKSEAGEHDLRVVTIFSFAANEANPNADGLIGDSDLDLSHSQNASPYSRDKLESYIADYNALYKAKHSLKDTHAFYTYYKDISKRIKARERKDFNDKDRVDILLVVNMFLTGFDAKKINTLYVDKNLRYHSLIQAFSRTNRTLGAIKSHGNIVCFRNLKPQTDEALTLFSNPQAQESVLLETYEEYVSRFNAAVAELHEIVPTADAVDQLVGEEALLSFVQAFRRLMRLWHIMKPFTEFSFDDLALDAQDFEDYKSKYLDIKETATRKEKQGGASIIDEVDFELELIQRDEINVDYILRLLAELKAQEQAASNEEERAQSAQTRQAILDLLSKEAQLRSKRELIEKFINEYLPNLPAEADIKPAFQDYWEQQKQAAIQAFCDSEQMDKAATMQLFEDYVFTGKPPERKALFDARVEQPKILERQPLGERLFSSMQNLVQTFYQGMGF